MRKPTTDNRPPRRATGDSKSSGGSVWPGQPAKSAVRGQLAAESPRRATAPAKPPARTQKHATTERPARTERPPRRAAAEPAAPRKSSPRPPPVWGDAAPVETPDAVIERKLYGVNACLAFIRQRGDDIIRAYFVADVAKQHFGKLMKLLAETRRAYHIVEADEMQKVTDSMHHEGVCLLVRDAPALRINDWLEQTDAQSQSKSQSGIVLALEDVGNPHNLGAIMRTAAHFGVAAIMVSGAERLRSGAAMRTAAGGAESVPLVEATAFIDGLKLLKQAGYTIVMTSSHKGHSVFATQWPARVCIVMGEEQHGVSRAALALADQCVSIPGTGAVESLNVSVATAIVVAQCASAQQAARRTPGTLRKPS